MNSNHIVVFKLLLICLSTVVFVNELIPAIYPLCPENERVFGWSMYDTHGRLISRPCGELKLTISPSLLYENRSNQMTDTFSINEVGMRGKSPQKDSHKQLSHKIFMLGGSETFGLGLNGDNETIAAHLERQLKNVDVYNAGVIGYSSGQEAVQLFTRINDYHPNTVISVSGWNDVLKAITIGDRNFDPSFGELTDIEYQLGVASKLSHGNIVERIMATFPRLVLSNFIAMYRRELIRFPKSNLSDAEKFAEQAAEGYVKNIVKMQSLASVEKYKLFVVIQPDGNSIHWPDSGIFPKSYIHFRELVTKDLAERKIPFFDANDLGDKLPRSAFLDSVHLSGLGNSNLANEIAKQLVRNDNSLSLRE